MSESNGPDALKNWLKRAYQPHHKRQERFCSLSFREQPVLGVPASGDGVPEKIGFPGEYPYTRGIHPTMYRGRLWTMRQFAGFGLPENTNQRFRYLLRHGQTGLSTAFDMPTLMGYDPDHPRSAGEVGREGVCIATIDDMDRLFGGIDQASITASMTINCTAPMAVAMYFAVARRRGVSWDKLGGTVQNDMLKEFIAQKEWICPPQPSVKLACDVIEFCASHAPRFHPISISGYHIREAGATAVQELAFTLADGMAYVEHCLNRGIPVDRFAPRLSFFFDVHNDFFEEVAKFRAARRMWARIMRDRFGAKEARSCMLRTHAQTAGVSLTAQQPLNNVVRVSLQALAAVLGGVQSLHTNSMDETLSLPTEEAAKVALRTQQIIAEETGVANVIDPLGGSWYLEDLTDRLESEANEYINRIDALGGMLKAVENGYPQREIADAAYRFQQKLEHGEIAVVGVNKYRDDSEQSVPLHRVDHSAEAAQVERIRHFRAQRDERKWKRTLDGLRDACRNGENIMLPAIDAVDAGVTLGEIADVVREVFGVYSDPASL